MNDPQLGPARSLEELGLVGAGPVPEFENLTRLARDALGAAISLVSMVHPDRDEQVFPGATGLVEPLSSERRTPLSHSFCRHVAERDEPLVVTDARRDPLVATNGAVCDYGFQAYLGVPVYNDEGPPVGALCVIELEPRTWTGAEIEMLRRLGSCVTDAIRAQRLLLQAAETQGELQRVQERLGEAVVAGEVGLWERDVESGDFWVSEKYSELHGGTTDDWTGLESFIERFHPDDQAALGPLLRAGREPNRTYEWIYRYRLDDGTYRWLRSLSTLTDRAGQRTRLAGATVDITAEREREEAIATLNAQLAEVNESLSEFVRVASHDLKAPLRTMRLLLDFAKEEHPDLPDSLVGYLDRVDRQSERMAKLLNDMLSYLVAGTAAAETTEVELESVATDVFSLLTSPDHLELAVDPRVATAHIDRFALSTVLRNLVDNAIKHSADRPGTVRVVFDRHQRDPDVLVVEIEDSGPGIPEDQIDRIFQPFHRLTSKSTSDGSGLGLAIVHRLILRASATIEVESALGVGSTFRILWPASHIEMAAVSADAVR